MTPQRLARNRMLAAKLMAFIPAPMALMVVASKGAAWGVVPLIVIFATTLVAGIIYWNNRPRKFER